MLGFGYLSSAIAGWMKKQTTDQFTIGKVVDTNDPEQAGRIRVRCAGFNDGAETLTRNLPWAIPISPLAGVTSFGRRGATQDEINGPVAYGMWNVPKVGSYVLVGCFDGNRGRRFYTGGINPHLATHTLPHGRYSWYEDFDEGLPDGPLATNESPIEPTYANQTAQFTKQGSFHAPETPDDPRRNLEYRTRGADMQASAINYEHLGEASDSPGSQFADHQPGEQAVITQEDKSTRKILGSGYGLDQHEPEDRYPSTGGVNYDPQTYSWTTPGFHSFSMNDRADNCRIRLRTTGGHQILMDDTNERMYISTAGGETWIEIDQVGNIDIYAAKNISTHAGGDINFFSDKSIRMQAKEGIHIRTDDEFRVHALKDIHTLSGQTIRTHAIDQIRLECDKELHVQVGATLHMSSLQRMNFTSGEYIVGDAVQIHWNSAVATAAQPAEEIHANWNTRVPEHEPWARVFMKESITDATATDKVNNFEHEYEYTSQMVGKGGRGDTYTRNRWWNR